MFERLINACKTTKKLNKIKEKLLKNFEKKLAEKYENLPSQARTWGVGSV